MTERDELVHMWKDISLACCTRVILLANQGPKWTCFLLGQHQLDMVAPAVCNLV
jgi:hypothetical protein